MSAGKPNWRKLHAMGKLPKDQIHQLPELRELETKIEVSGEVKGNETIISSPVKVLETNFKCLECDFVGKNANGLRFHSKKHNKTN